MNGVNKREDEEVPVESTKVLHWIAFVDVEVDEEELTPPTPTCNHVSKLLP